MVPTYKSSFNSKKVRNNEIKKNKKIQIIFNRWRHVGELSELYCFPIKSCGPIREKTLKCTNLGVENNFLRDRTFMVLLSSNGKFTTARQYPKLVHIFPRFDGEDMILKASGMTDIRINVPKLLNLETSKTEVWGKPVDFVDCGDDVARWFSRYLVDEDFGMRLVFYPSSHPSIEAVDKSSGFLTMSTNDTGAMHDETSYMIINESSITELNTRLKKHVNPLRFRGNFVVRGAEPWEEDKWKWVKIGNETVFRYIKPCTRCFFTNVDPETAEKDPNGETLKALKEYRLFPKFGPSPCCGIHLGMRVPGNVSLGDSIYVSYK